jgi:hypothetical protein
MDYNPFADEVEADEFQTELDAREAANLEADADEDDNAEYPTDEDHARARAEFGWAVAAPGDAEAARKTAELAARLGTTPRPTADHPATWLRVADLRIGDLVVTRGLSDEDREAGHEGGPTARVTELASAGNGQARRWVVWVAGQKRPHYPSARDNTPVLVLRPTDGA